MKVKSRHIYHLNISWTGNKGQGTGGYRVYDRSHTVSTDNKVDIYCSSDPAFHGDKTKHNPEELFLASISSCHMLWYLHLCADCGIIVRSYTDHAEGVMVETFDGGGHFAEVTLHPIVIVANNSMIQKAIQLHYEAHQFCFIANSCNFPIYHKPVCTADNA